MEFRLDKGTGYMYSYSPNHPCANKAGKVMEHVYVIFNKIGRVLDSNECVHHIDRNKTNNSLDNLMLMTISEHARLHYIEDQNVEYINNNCPNCNKDIKTTVRANKKYCSYDCATNGSRLFNVTKENLHYLVWNHSTVKVSKMFNVSDVAIAKRCKLLGVNKPPRGYWAKFSNNKLKVDLRGLYGSR